MLSLKTILQGTILSSQYPTESALWLGQLGNEIFCRKVSCLNCLGESGKFKKILLICNYSHNYGSRQPEKLCIRYEWLREPVEQFHRTTSLTRPKINNPFLEKESLLPRVIVYYLLRSLIVYKWINRLFGELLDREKRFQEILKSTENAFRLNLNFIRNETVAKYKVSRQTYENYKLSTAICANCWHYGSQLGEIIEENFTTGVFRNGLIIWRVCRGINQSEFESVRSKKYERDENHVATALLLFT